MVQNVLKRTIFTDQMPFMGLENKLLIFLKADYFRLKTHEEKSLVQT